MRKVNRDWKDIPKKLKHKDTISVLEALIKNPTLKISDSIYKDPYKDPKGKTKSKVRDKLNEYYYHKCAYCETSGGKADIEHYRPKKNVKENTNHKGGYYWLAYEWSNLLPSCKDCNREGGKNAMFPILGTYVVAPTFLTNGDLNTQDFLPSSTLLSQEEPYLLHPEIDEPKNHLGFEINSGNTGIDVVPIDLQKTSPISRGSETIRVCDLNREPLQLNRVNCVINIIKDDFTYILKLKEDNILNTSRQLIIALKCKMEIHKKNALDEKKQYTLLWWYIMDSIQNFKQLVLPSFKYNEQLILETVYNKYF
jgi:uncharacterized protein (TIGR02646 family)